MLPSLYFNKYYKLNYITMSKGTVKFFNNTKGFGFITEEGVEKDHFVHISGLIDEIRESTNMYYNDTYLLLIKYVINSNIAITLIISRVLPCNVYSTRLLLTNDRRVG